MPLDVVIEGQCILLDSPGDEDRTKGVILSIGRILNGEECDIECFDEWLQEVPQRAEVFSVTVEVDEAFFLCSAGLVGDFQVGHHSFVLLGEIHTLLK